MNRSTLVWFLLFGSLGAMLTRTVSLASSGSSPASQVSDIQLPAPPAPESMVFSTIPLPSVVTSAVLINYLPDGKHLIMEVHLAGGERTELAVMADDGSGFRCLTNGVKGEVGGEMPVPLPDGRRVYTPRGIMECSPSIMDCREAVIVPLEYPELKGAKTLARFATNLSPDGIHVAYTIATTRGVFVLLSELERVSDQAGLRYRMAKTRVVGGSRHFLGDPSDLRPSSFGSGEVKSFTDQGRSLATVSAFEGSNFDVAKIDLASGSYSQFTRHFSWDEGVYPSPDGQWVVVQTHRHTTRMDAFGLIPRPLIAGLDMGYGVGNYRNEVVKPGKVQRRFYGLVLLDKFGDRARLPEDGYVGQMLDSPGDESAEYSHFGNFTWDPTSTQGVFWEQRDPLRVKAGEVEGRLRMVRFTSRRPTKPLPVFTPECTWAPTLEELPASAPSMPDHGRLLGAVSGYVDMIIERRDGAMPGRKDMHLDYHDFCDEPGYVLNGAETVTNLGGPIPDVRWTADISVSGARLGCLRVKDVALRPWKIGSGTIHAELGDRIIDVDLAKGLPTRTAGELR